MAKTWAIHKTTETVLYNGWRLAVGGWRLAVGGWRLAVGGPRGLSLTKKNGGSKDSPVALMLHCVPLVSVARTCGPMSFANRTPGVGASLLPHVDASQGDQSLVPPKGIQ